MPQPIATLSQIGCRSFSLIYIKHTKKARYKKLLHFLNFDLILLWFCGTNLTAYPLNMIQKLGGKTILGIQV